MLQVAVVEDDPSFGRAFSRLLRASGMHPTLFASAEAYLEAPGGTRFDCLVLDIQLGGMSGIELQRRLSGTCEPAPVIFLSAHQEPEMVVEVARSGCLLVPKAAPGRVVLDAIRKAAGGPS